MKQEESHNNARDGVKRDVKPGCLWIGLEVWFRVVDSEANEWRAIFLVFVKIPVVGLLEHSIFCKAALRSVPHS